MSRPVLQTRLCEQLHIEYPILLAGMGGWGRATPPALVAAVSEAGGLGVLGGSNLDAEEIRRRIRDVRTRTDKPFGVDLLLPASLAQAETTRSAVRQRVAEDFPEHMVFMHSLRREFDLPDVQVEDEIVISSKLIEEQVEVVFEERVPVFAAGLGDPSWMVPRAHEQGMVVMGLVGNVRNAIRQVEAGVDIIVAQGYEAGGHTGRIANFPLLPQVVDAVSPMPVVAAGGIADGRGIAAALALGTIGAWVGTAFLVAEECDIPEDQKDQILLGPSEAFVITRSFTGKTARNYRNPVVEAWERSELEPLPMPYQRVLMEDFMECAIRGGRDDLYSNPSGQIGGMLKTRKPAAQIMAELVRGTVDALNGLRQSVVTAAG